ncbi:MAG: caspase family protein [Blastomonas sp.]
MYIRVLAQLLAAFVALALGLASVNAQQPASAAPTATVRLAKDETAPLARLQKLIEGSDERAIHDALAVARNAVTSADGKWTLGALIVNHVNKTNEQQLLREGLDLMLDSGSVNLQGTTAKLRYARAALAYQAGDFDTARSDARLVLLEDPGNVDAMIVLAEVQIQTGNPAEGIALIDRAIRQVKSSGKVATEQWYRRALSLAYREQLAPQMRDMANKYLAAYPSQENRYSVEMLLKDANSWSNMPAASSAPQASAAKPLPAVETTIPAQTGPRYALVIGNGAYTSLGPLANPANDAQLMAERLRQAGFVVDLRLEADQKTMKRAISEFGQRLSSAGSNTTGLFYFAGHGLQFRGRNYLIPVDSVIKSDADIDIESVPADSVLFQMEEAQAGTTIVILDACRNTPIFRSMRNAAVGLAGMDAPNGSFISYSTAPGDVALDGEGDNSPFAAALARQLLQPNQPIEALFRNVRKEVLKETDGQQTPWDSSSLLDTFVFMQR